jgi:hypothetical protein
MRDGMFLRLKVIYPSDFKDNFYFWMRDEAGSGTCRHLVYRERLGYQPCWFNVNEGREVQNHPTQPIKCRNSSHYLQSP